MNPVIPKEAFQLKPYPFDDVINADSGAFQPAADPAWMNLDEIEFPFRDFAVMLATSGIAPRQATASVASDEGWAAASSPPEGRGYGGYILWGLSGLAIVAGVVLRIYWKR